MTKVNIKDQKQINGGWDFWVEITDTESKSEIKITLDKEYWEKLNDAVYVPEELIRKSVEFLLQREPKESILKEFNLREISKYFPEYEKEIVKFFPTTK